MSYILDALKKSDQERQQGTAPHLHSAHGSLPPLKGSSAFIQRRAFWLISGGVLLITCCLGLFFFLHQQHLTETVSTPATDTAVLSAEPQTSQPTALQQPPDQVVQIKESSHLRLVEDKSQDLQSIAIEDSTSDAPVVIQPKPLPAFLPLLQDLSSELKAGIPNLKFAGHTFSKNPSQRMIIVNGKILKEGGMIAPNTHLTEITWEGVIIEFNGTRFRVITN